MTFFQAVILGIIQGLTEFIPISSSAHLVIIRWLFGWNDPVLTGLSFDIALHMGTLVALIVFFAPDWARLIKAGAESIIERKIKGIFDRRLVWFLIIGCIPGGLAGAFLESKIEKLFHTTPINPSAMIAMGIVIALMGGLLFAADRLIKHTRRMEQMSVKDAALIGLAQALAIFPGVSRSGSTITAGMALGLKREAAARFSFLLSAPIIAGAGLKSLYDLFKEIKLSDFVHNDLVFFIAGFITAAVTGFFCIKFLLRFLQKNSTDVFAYYRWFLAALVIIVALMRR